MKTEILDKNDYPFQIERLTDNDINDTQHVNEAYAITTHFALIRTMAEDILVLSPTNIDDAIKDKTGDCIAKGYFSNIGNRPNTYEWKNGILPLAEGMNETDIETIRNEVWTVVEKLFKGKKPSSIPNISPDERMTGVKLSANDNIAFDPTQRIGADWIDKRDMFEDEDEDEDSGEIIVNKVLNLDSIEPTVSLRNPNLRRDRQSIAI